MILPLPVAHLITLPIVCHVRVRAAVKAPPRKKLAERRARFSSAGPWIQKSLRGKKTRREEKERIRETVAGKSSVTSSRRIRTCLLKAIVFCFWEKQRRRVAPKTQKKKKLVRMIGVHGRRLVVVALCFALQSAKKKATIIGQPAGTGSAES